MKLSEKLDSLQDMAIDCTGDVHALYLISLLAEHAEEEECTEEVLRFVKSLLVTY